MLLLWEFLPIGLCRLVPSHCSRFRFARGLNTSVSCTVFYAFFGILSLRFSHSYVVLISRFALRKVAQSLFLVCTRFLGSHCRSDRTCPTGAKPRVIFFAVGFVRGLCPRYTARVSPLFLNSFGALLLQSKGSFEFVYCIAPLEQSHLPPRGCSVLHILGVPPLSGRIDGLSSFCRADDDDFAALRRPCFPCSSFHVASAHRVMGVSPERLAFVRFSRPLRYSRIQCDFLFCHPPFLFFL